MIDLHEHCSLHALSSESPIKDFICDSDDLNDFFCNDAIKYQNELLGETFYYRLKETGEIICAYTLSNDSLKVSDLPGSRKRAVKKEIPHEKSMKAYPAMLIGRLGVSKKHEGNGIGTQLLNYIKGYTFTELGSKCRYLLVDSYNNEKALALYKKNEFNTVFSSEEQEREYYEKPEGEPLKTRFMYFDLMLWQNQLA